MLRSEFTWCWGLIVYVFPLIVLTGCDDEGVEMQYRIPHEFDKRLHLEIVIDKETGQVPEHVAPGVFAIDFSKDGVAVINSPKVLRGWRKEYIVTPTRKLRRFYDFQKVDSGSKMAHVTEKLPGGGVRSYSVEQGSKYWMDFEIVEPSP